MTKYPKVLIVGVGRINAADTYNNGMFLRSLFGSEWPRLKLAQIYSSGDMHDHGFFGSYYRIGARERVFGGLFYRLKPAIQENTQRVPRHGEDSTIPRNALRSWIKRKAIALFVDTGLYELVFQPKLSNELITWINDFDPDIIFAQGYSLTFSWLPVMIKRETGAKLAVLTTDDWPVYLYSGLLGEATIFRWLMQPFVKRAANALFAAADVPFAFGSPMAEEYRVRYRREFTVINHADEPERFAVATPFRPFEGCLTIMAIGTFNKYRLPLLLDASDACEELAQRGFNVRLLVLSSSLATEGYEGLLASEYIDVLPDPGNDQLPAYLKCADAFLLAEGFDPGFVAAIKLSISTKAHLFMLSEKPIVVYAHSQTGISRYAEKYGWAAVVAERSKEKLVEVFTTCFSDPKYSKALVDKAREVANEFHTYEANRKAFITALTVDK